MYLFSMLVVIVTIILMLFISGGVGSFTSFMDFPSLLLLILIVIPILAGTNMLKDFNNAFRLAMTKKKIYSMPELKRASEAVKLVMQTLICAGLLISMAGIILSFKYAEGQDTNLLFANFSIAILPILYALGFELILLPIRAKVNRLMIDFMQE